MRHTQFLVFEITDQCNLAEAHKHRCPVALPDRYGTLDTSRPLTDDLIVECVRTAYQKLGFQGHVAWHYYCEPLLCWPRLRPLMARIVAEVPAAKFLLWTNGTLLDSMPTEELTAFDSIVITNYFGRDFRPLSEQIPEVNIRVLRAGLDDRAECRLQPGNARCLRQFVELIIDHYGNGHLCCMDFRGQCRLGNVWDDGFEQVVLNFLEVRDMVSTAPMPPEAPEVCRTCSHRVTEAAGHFCLPRKEEPALSLIGD